MTDLNTVAVEIALKVVEAALKGPKYTRKNIKWLIRHREKTYYRFMLQSPDWMHFMRRNFKLKPGTQEEILQDVKFTENESFLRILKNIEFLRRKESEHDDGRIELFWKNLNKFEQHWWNAENFWNNERPALEYRRKRKLKMNGANWYFHGGVPK